MKKRKIYIKCPRENCGYSWAPSPWMWRNKKQLRDVDKMFKCPRCTRTIIVPKKIVGQIIKYNKREIFYGRTC
jgi:hypothetical protein